MTITRTSLARFLVAQPAKDQRRLISQAAAWLIATGQTRRVGELASEVARLQAEQGDLWATVTTARPLTPASTKQIERFLKQKTGARRLQVEAKVDPAMIGGILIETPDRRLDATISAKLRRFEQEASA